MSDGSSATSGTTSEAAGLVGTVVAERYKLLDLLGEGGMGAVYRGEHVTLRKRVAVKFLHKEMAQQEEMVKRFRREAEAVARLEHPNIVAANDFGQLPDGSFFMVMEYIEGRPLRTLLATEGALDPVRAVGILGQIASALSRAHHENIVHRDLKPENVIVCDREGQKDLVKLIDFGIARDMARKGTMLTQMGAVFGTPHYMSPEQAVGQPVDARADQYALGVIAFELFTGSPPYDAMDMLEVMQKHIGAPIPRASELVQSLRPELDSVLERMLAKLPDERFPSVSEAMRAMELVVLGAARQSVVPAAPPVEAIPVVARVTGVLPTLPVVSSAPPQPSPFSRTVQDLRALRLTKHTIPLIAGVLVLLVVAVVLLSSREPPKPAASGASLRERLEKYQKEPAVSDALSKSVQGDATAAIALFASRLDARENDALAAYHLGHAQWSAGHVAEAVDAFATAVHNEPAFADDPTIHQALLEHASTTGNLPAITDIWEHTALARSRRAVLAAANTAIDDPIPAQRVAALVLTKDHIDLLPALTRQRIRLRLSERCDQVVESLRALAAMDAPEAQVDLRTLRSNRCTALLSSELCRCQQIPGP